MTNQTVPLISILKDKDRNTIIRTLVKCDFSTPIICEMGIYLEVKVIANEKEHTFFFTEDKGTGYIVHIKGPAEDANDDNTLTYRIVGEKRLKLETKAKQEEILVALGIRPAKMEIVK